MSQPIIAKKSDHEKNIDLRNPIISTITPFRKSYKGKSLIN